MSVYGGICVHFVQLCVNFYKIRLFTGNSLHAAMIYYLYIFNISTIFGVKDLFKYLRIYYIISNIRNILYSSVQLEMSLLSTGIVLISE